MDIVPSLMEVAERSKFSRDKNIRFSQGLVPEKLSKASLDIHNLMLSLIKLISKISASLERHLENDANYLSEALNSLSRYSSDISKSEFQLYNDRPEIKGRFKLLNIQIQKTKLNIEDWTKEKGLEELNKIFVFYNYSIETIKSILDDSLIN